jgi:hypothetical protein
MKIIAETGEQFVDFAPYVASVDKGGVVAFQATLQNGATGVFTGDGDSPAALIDGCRGIFEIKFFSHPDINAAGRLSVYASDTDGFEGVYVATPRELMTIVDNCGIFARIGPLGPTLNNEGTVAFRADTKSGLQGIYLGDEVSVVTVADTRHFTAFQGVPVINNKGTVVFRADLKNGGQGIYAAMEGTLLTIAETGAVFSELGQFPTVNDADTVVFSAVLKSGISGVFRVAGNQIHSVMDSAGQFESFRGALINSSDTIVYYATPRSGKLGVYSGLAAEAKRVIGIGDVFLDSKIVDLALNPVSLSDDDQVAIRLALEDQRQLIVRADLRA